MALLYAGLIEGPEYSRSGLNVRRVYVFDTHSLRGTEPSYITTNRVKITRRDPMADNEPSSIDDYEITVDTSSLDQKGISLYCYEDGSTRTAHAAHAAK